MPNDFCTKAARTVLSLKNYWKNVNCASTTKEKEKKKRKKWEKTTAANEEALTKKQKKTHPKYCECEVCLFLKNYRAAHMQ